MKHELNFKQIGEWTRNKLPTLWKSTTHRGWLKICSLLLAILLWNYVVSGDSSLTRTKTIYNVNGSVTGQSGLSTYGLALLSDPDDLLEGFTVQIDVAQSQYSYASPDNVRVSLDLSGVRTPGTQDVPLTAVTAYGRVLNIVPDTVSLTFDSLDARSIPVNVEFSGDVRNDYWYSVSRTNPANITVSGAASVVRSIAQARVYSDVTGSETGYTRAEQYVLLDSEGKEINQGMLTRSSTSVTVVSEIYPKKEIPISTSISDVVTGYAADGFEVVEVSVQPETVTVAADNDLLDSISELKIEPVSVDGVSQSFTARAKISLLSDFKDTSAEEVYVNVTIASEANGEWVNITGIELTGMKDSYSAIYSIDGIRVWVEGSASRIAECKRSGIVLTADLTDLDAGVHECRVGVDAERYPGLTIIPETDTVTITISSNNDK